MPKGRRQKRPGNLPGVLYRRLRPGERQDHQHRGRLWRGGGHRSRHRDIEQMLTGKAIEKARALKADCLSAYSARMSLTQGRVSAEYRKAVCMNLLGDFLTEFGIFY